VDASSIERSTRIPDLHVPARRIVSASHLNLTVFVTDWDYSVLFASIYRFTTIMQFDMADTTGTLATACTWCVVEVASGIISACLPTLRPLMLLVSSQFSSTQNRSGKGSATGGRSHKTELVTIGGTGNKSNQNFRRLKNDYDVYSDAVATHTHGGRDDASSLSGDERPLARVIHQQEARLSSSRKSSV
jgi:hypothetical protein